MFAGLGLFPAADLRPFNQQYKCYSMAMWQSNHVSDEKVKDMEDGGKILLPHSALDYLTRLHINYPMLFKITNPNPAHARITHGGVMEFHQEEGKCFIPYWMMRNLLLSEGEIVQVEYVGLPVATYVKFKPQSVDFLDITNPRAVLELKLRNFSCLTKSDMIAINYNNKIYELLVQDLKPGNAVSIIECDMNVEFDAPVGYKEPERVFKKDVEPKPHEVHQQAPPNTFLPFSGKGQRIDGKEKAVDLPKPVFSGPIQRGIPNYDYKPGTLTFIRTSQPKATPKNQADDSKEFKPFGGDGQKLKPKNR